MLNGRKRKTTKTGEKRTGENNINTCNGLGVASCDSIVLQHTFGHLKSTKISAYFPELILCHDHPYSRYTTLDKQTLSLNKSSFFSCCPTVFVEEQPQNSGGQLATVLVKDKSLKKIPKVQTDSKKEVSGTNPRTKHGHPKHSASSKKGNAKVIQRNSNEGHYTRTLTDYFPVRRSSRKTSFTIKKEKQNEVEEAVLSGKEEGFEVKDIVGKGRGVFTTKKINRGEFVLEYHGELINMQEAKIREAKYAADENIGCYMYYFVYKNKQYCVDATKDTGRLGRLVNHSINGNLKTLPFPVEDVPRLILIAKRDIEAGEELLYDYGDRSKSSLACHPWLAT